MPKSTNFSSILEEALKKYTEPRWLGAHSPLAFPYLLSQHSSNGSSSPQKRGVALQKLLAEAAMEITGKNSERYQTILHEYYFAGRSVVAACDVIGLSKNPFHIGRRAAIEAMQEPVIRRLHPALRLETRVLSNPLVARTELTAKCIELLKQRRSLGLLGASGIGKSALLAELSRSWTQPTLWYTVRPGVNDRPENLIFALALFMHQHGHSTLWQELIATQGQLDVDKSSQILRYMLDESDLVPLLCIDNCDELSPSTNSAHQTFRELIHSLQLSVTICCAGMILPFDLDEYIEIEPLSQNESIHLLQDRFKTDERSMDLVPADGLRSLHEFTGGNPRLLLLGHSLLAQSASIEDVEILLAQRPTVTQLLDQLLARLTQSEVDSLLALSVYRTPAPLHLWQKLYDAPPIERLQKYQLIQVDEQGGVEVVPVYRTHLFAQLTDAERREYHVAAAALRTTVAMNTSVLYHLIQADQIEEALWLWREHQQQEIDQGQASTALDLLDELAEDSAKIQQISNGAKDLLALLIGDLAYCIGRLPQAAESLQQIRRKDDALSVAAEGLAGVIANDQSQFTTAEAHFQAGLATTTRLIEATSVSIHKGLGWMYFRQRDLDKAEVSLDMAHFEIENMRGNIAHLRCLYDDAAAFYQSALAYAIKNEFTSSEAKVSSNLAGVLLFNGQFDTCHQHLSRAASIYKSLGKLAAEAGCKITIVVAFNLAEKYTDASNTLNEVASLFASMMQVPSWLNALYHQAMAETMLGLGKLDEAQEAVDTVIGLEEADVLSDAYRTQGEIMLQRGSFDAAEQSLRQALEMAEQMSDSYLGAYAWRAMGDYHIARSDPDEAHAAYEKARELFLEMNLTHEAERTGSERLLDN